MTATQTGDERPYTPKPANYKPVATFTGKHRYAGKTRCKAWSPHAGRQCGNLAMTDRAVCRMHGGKTPRGKDSPHYKHGGRSKDILESKIGEKFSAMLADEQLLSLRDNVAVGYVRVSELVAELDKGGVPDLPRLQALHRQMLAAIRGEDSVALSAAIGEFGAHVNSAAARDRAWKEIFRTQEQIRRQTMTEKRIMTDAEHMVPVDVVLKLAQVIALEIRQVIELRITDSQLRRHVLIDTGDRVRKILGATVE